jgi:hypothetical protein
MAGTPERVDFEKVDFDNLVKTKGVRLYHEEALRCACVSEQSGSAFPSCVNCFGVGFVFRNGSNVKGVVQSVGYNPKYTQWSEVNAGTAMVTARFENRLAWMDRLTIMDGEGVFTETVYVKELIIGGQTKLIGLCTYEPLDVSVAYRFEGESVSNVLLAEGTDFELTGRKLELLTGSIGTNRSIHVSLRYRHRPQYIVMDIPKDVRNTRVVESGGVEKRKSLPVNAMIKKVHYFMGYQGIAGAAGN